jgi:uncharacterized membrane protein SpoIIM required for sporulation
MIAKDDPARLLEQLLARSDRGKALSFDDTRSLAQLYRLNAARLSVLRQRGDDADAVRALNALCVRAYALVHAVPRHPVRTRAWILRELPRALAHSMHLQILSAVLLVCGGLLGARIASLDPGALPALVPMSMYSADALERLATSEAARERFLTRTEVGASAKSMFGASLFANNTRVGLLAFASGPLAALPTVLLLLYNGLTLGAFSAMFVGTPQTVAFLAWLVPHGIPELLAIVLCASGGLSMGLAVVAPSRAGRLVCLRAAASEAVALVLAALPLFVIAALIESFVRQSLWSTTLRFVVAALVCGALGAYVWTVRWLARREARVETGFLDRLVAPSVALTGRRAG